MNKLDLAQIDLTTHEGRLLQAAIIELTTRVHTNMTPYEIIDRLYTVADNSQVGNRDKSWPECQKDNVYAQIDRLSKFMLREIPLTIKEGGAVDNAIRILRDVFSVKKTTGGEEIPSGKFIANKCESNTPFADAIKKAVNRDEQLKQQNLFTIQSAGETVLLAAKGVLPSIAYNDLEGILVAVYRQLSGQ